MNKKFLCLILAIVMVLGTLAGCSTSTSEEDVEATADTEESSRISMTLSLWLPTYEGTTQEAIDLVEAEINTVTQAQFDTAIELNLVPADEYDALMLKKHDDIAAAILQAEEEAESKRLALKEQKANGETVEESESESETPAATEEETIVNELGISIKKYPEVAENQIDIFLVRGYENYTYYIENNYLSQLDTELSGNSKILKTYIYPTFLNLANVGGTYAIPNNHPVGEYQYLLVNKELVDKYDYNPDDLTSVLKCGDFIKDIGYQNLEGVVPLLSEVETANLVFWGEDESEWSIIGSQIANTAKYDDKCEPKNLFNTAAYMNNVLLMKELKALGYVGDGTLKEGEKFAVGVISGDASVIEEYEEDYYVTIYAKPVCDEEDIFGAMFAVSAYTKKLERSMEVVTYLNTNEELRTILQYGARGVHWDYTEEDSTETIKILSKDYNMNLLETGNVYMTYPGEGISKDYWEYGKIQNRDMVTSPYIKFPGYANEENAELLAKLAEVSKSYKERLDALTVEEYEEGVKALKDEVKKDPVVSGALDKDPETGANSIIGIYSAWYNETYPQQ